jgi:hypothetical protein
MKRQLLAALLAATTATGWADEGMWTLSDLPQAVFEQMQAEGLKLSKDQLWGADNAVARCVVNFGGFCSGVVVSPNGLVFTNHHCGFEAIRSHSTVEHDYMLNGFNAKTFQDELPNQGLFVSFMVEQQDVTEEMKALGIDKMNRHDRNHLIDSIENVKQKQLSERDSTLRAELKPFYERNRYYLTTYRDYEDVRLVFAVPKSMGKFGGETDNWMWPRQTCDFSVFRVYVDPVTGGPAKYSKKNVPMQTQHYAPVATDGYQEGSFSMTMGYPGSTNRYLSSYGIRERRDAINEPRVNVRTVKQEVMKRHMDQSEAVRIKYDSKYAHSSNYWKNSIGMNKCIDSIGLIGQKEQFEQQLSNFNAEAFAVKELSFPLMQQLYERRMAVTKARTMLMETFLRDIELPLRAFRVHNGMKVQGPDKKPKRQYVTFEDNSDQWDQPTERDMLVALLENYRKQMDGEWLPDFFKETIDAKFGGSVADYVDALYAKSLLNKSGKRIYINKKNYEKDLGVQFGRDITTLWHEIRSRLDGLNDSIDAQEKLLCAAKLAYEKEQPHYSDANFTLRLSYGQVGGFMLAGKPSGWYTTAQSIVDKMNLADKVEDYKAEPIMKTLMSAGDFGSYTDAKTGQMHLCFLTNNDITGGNSGSPMFGDKGQLLGLAFDGNWDSLSSDIFFDTRLARCIGVDIRYVLYLMDRWGHADRLLEEMGVK